ncbi:hypothetical protein HYFRA_00012605 [Hymenoscyphus fraxineus]|uniref:Uncharacterized protein n=1 Tax=Hymenoscyphus fraxineus TaxID=746836 RepID=A0A9N9L964_9HELO|nr:hypothetical protein HYFRA_00012605 [Hymenoscyphus fraxineus]
MTPNRVQRVAALKPSLNDYRSGYDDQKMSSKPVKAPSLLTIHEAGDRDTELALKQLIVVSLHPLEKISSNERKARNKADQGLGKTAACHGTQDSMNVGGVRDTKAQSYF